MTEQQPKLTRQEQAWLKRLQKLVDTQPPGTHVFVSGSGWGATINLLRLGSDGKKVIDHSGSFDKSYIVGTVDTGNWDGGGW